MRTLVDTHALLWWLGDAPELGPAARATLLDPDTEALVSAASLWEIAIKRSLGKLDAPDDLPAVVEREGFAWLAVSPAHAWHVRDLERHHGDPFDRLLVAQAHVEGLPILSADRRLDAYGIDRRWA